MGISRRSLLAGAAALPLVTVLRGRAKAAEFNIRWGHSRPLDLPEHIRSQEVCDAVREETGGRVEMKLFGAQQLGGDTDMLSQVRSGALEFYNTTAPFIMNLVPVAGISGLSFAFPSYDEVWKANDGELGNLIRSSVGEAGIHVFERFWDQGYRQVSSSTRVIKTAADLDGFKIRVPVIPIFFSAFKALGAAPTSLNLGEVYTALQTGLVEGYEGAFSLFYASRFQEVQKHIALTNHVWDGLIVTANGRYWNSLTEDIRETISKHMNAAGEKEREDIRLLNESLRTKLQDGGIVFNEVESASFREKLKENGYYAEWKGKFGDKAWEVLESYVGSLS